MTGLYKLNASDIVRAYGEKALSPADIMESLLEHISAWEPYLNALYAFDPERARRAAAESAQRWTAGVPRGPLDGVPVTVKENIATKGTPVPLGTAATELAPAKFDAPPAARLREAGAIIFAKTTMPDYGMLSSGLSSFHGITRNPWDLDKNPGGSSAGAAAAAAAGYGPLHIGTDIGGSVRLPACWCGIFALKPSLGRVPIDPPYVGRVAGPMTRSVDDAALLMSVLSQPDARDGMSLPPADLDWHVEELPLGGIHIGLMLDIGAGMALDPEVRDAVTAAARLFESAGAHITEVPPILTREMLDGLDTFRRARAWDDLSKLSGAMLDRVLPFIRQWAGAGATTTGVDVIRGFNQTMAIRREAGLLFESVDYLLSPVSPIVSFPAAKASPLDDPNGPFEHIGFTVPWNMSEQPAASINAGYSGSGFPIGLQIVGRRFDDLGVLRLAKSFEAMRGAQHPWPVPPSSATASDDAAKED
jgi:aspartyl-tRNA(Asn)/glutamyl-tRNA(Gln) amidotransferase subunit A